jgi:hypothetical protein
LTSLISPPFISRGLVGSGSARSVDGRFHGLRRLSARRCGQGPLLDGCMERMSRFSARRPPTSSFRRRKNCVLGPPHLTDKVSSSSQPGITLPDRFVPTIPAWHRPPDGAHNESYLNVDQPTEFVAIERHFLASPQRVGDAEGQLARRAVQSAGGFASFSNSRSRS